MKAKDSSRIRKNWQQVTIHSIVSVQWCLGYHSTAVFYRPTCEAAGLQWHKNDKYNKEAENTTLQPQFMLKNRLCELVTFPFVCDQLHSCV